MGILWMHTKEMHRCARHWSQVWTFLIPRRGCVNQPRVVRQRTTLGRGRAIRSIPEGDEYAGAFGIYPLQGMGRWLSGCPRVAAGPQPWAALLIPFGEKRRLVDKSRGFQTRYLFRVCYQIKS